MTKAPWMSIGRRIPILFAWIAFVGITGTPALAQDKPWLLFLDSQSTSRCDAVNADNVRLVVLQDGGHLRIVSGTDVTLLDTTVDADGFVFFEGDPAGVIDFAVDGDGFRSLWWMSLTGNVVAVDGFTGEPSPTNKTPIDFRSAGCDACDDWDDASVCPATPPPTLHLCGVDVPVVAAMIAFGLMGLRLGSRRRLP